ncbi:nuclear transport factor 2 family protein [Enterococcus sp. DIV0187]|uniref:nuclear transport factor 2 family protein n=1 Tax=Enterococcus sp. DIV0187 TaxID=2774644 RepID=UPI003F22F2B6
MSREDYLEIKENFEKFTQAWKNQNSDLLDEVFVSEAACYLSTVEKYPCGSQHGVLGMKDFMEETPKPDFFHIIPCNYVSRLSGKIAQQSSTLVCRAGVYEYDDVRVLDFSALVTNKWEKTDTGWRIVEMRLDIVECQGEYKEFVEKWYFEKQDLKYYFGIHLPVISGDLDNPWERIKEDDDVKVEEEKVLEAFSKYAFGIDTLTFTLLTETLSDDLTVNMAPWGAMDKREFMQTLKFKRQANSYWDHPVTLDSIELKGDMAYVKLHRMAGHKQSNHPISITKENAEKVYADARYELKLRKENGIWKVFRLDYFLGTIDLGSYKEFCD